LPRINGRVCGVDLESLPVVPVLAEDRTDEDQEEDQKSKDVTP
jgi:hypothetical protein